MEALLPWEVPNSVRQKPPKCYGKTIRGAQLYYIRLKGQEIASHSEVVGDRRTWGGRLPQAGVGSGACQSSEPQKITSVPAQSGSSQPLVERRKEKVSPGAEMSQDSATGSMGKGTKRIDIHRVGWTCG